MRALLSLLLIVFFISTQTASANWYAGAWYPSAYGASASITTPATPLQIYRVPGPSGVANWVSLPPPNWIQTGWAYHPDAPNNTVPVYYYETCTNGCNAPGIRNYQEVGPQGWGVAFQYQIKYQAGTLSTWCAYVQYTSVFCQDVSVPPPATVEAESEVQFSNQNGLDTNFGNVAYQDSNANWWSFDQNEQQVHDFPYTANFPQFWNYHAYRLPTVSLYLPIIMK